MSKGRRILSVLVSVFVVGGLSLVAPRMASAQDFGKREPKPRPADLYVAYQPFENRSGFVWIVCGHTPKSSGCFRSGIVKPFNRICSMMHTKMFVDGKYYRRLLYIFDGGTQSSDKMLLYIYSYSQWSGAIREIDAKLELIQIVDLKSPGDATAKCNLAGSDDRVFAGSSSMSQIRIIIKKSGNRVILDSNSMPPSAIDYALADEDGRLVYGHQNGNFAIFDKYGSPDLGGGGGMILLNTTTGVAVP